MYYLNKIVGAFLNPLSISLLLSILALACWRWRRIAFCSLLLSVLWLWFWSTGLVTYWTGNMLEGPWLQQDGMVPKAETLPNADLIIVLSGGMGAATNVSPYAEMYAAADRVWHGARLFKAGKAPKIVLTGLNSRDSSVPLLKDFGVPEESILVDNDSLNTEQNAKFTLDLLKQAGIEKPKVLLVTSAYHMRRSLLMFQKYAPGLEVIPAPSDFQATVTMAYDVGIDWFLPSYTALDQNGIQFKEFIGYWGYRLLR